MKYKLELTKAYFYLSKQTAERKKMDELRRDLIKFIKYIFHVKRKL
jgi:phage regulator Rha-like protein